MQTPTLGEFLRKRGLHAAQLEEWRRVVAEAAKSALAPGKKPSHGQSKIDFRRIRELERELLRKDKALAELAALVALKKTGSLVGGRGREHSKEERAVIADLVEGAVRDGARQDQACKLLGLNARTLQRWKGRAIGDDLRAGPKSAPENLLSPHEREQIFASANLPEHRDRSPKQIVPLLADQGRYLASESSFNRVLKAAGQVHHRERSRPAQHSRPRELVATKPNQVWSWDITYLLSPVKGNFFYLHPVLDIFSRKIVGWEVHLNEFAEHAGQLIATACSREGVQREQVALHQDNGAPMKCSTFLALLQELGVAASFSRPGVSDDNPSFASLEGAREFIGRFVDWYNTEHLHGNIRFVTPAAWHAGKDRAILARRTRVSELARARRPERWSRATRDWSPDRRTSKRPPLGRIVRCRRPLGPARHLRHAFQPFRAPLSARGGACFRGFALPWRIH